MKEVVNAWPCELRWDAKKALDHERVFRPYRGNQVNGRLTSAIWGNGRRRFTPVDPGCPCNPEVT